MVRAIDIVERALARYGAPVYVRHEIVHNKYVVDDLKRKGAVFVDELDEIPDGDRPVDLLGPWRAQGGAAGGAASAACFRSMPPARSSPRSIWRRSAIMPKGSISCSSGITAIPKSSARWGSCREGAITLIETVAEAEAFTPHDPAKLAYVTQTTLSVDDTRDIVDVLKRRFPAIRGPYKEDICYATTNRQEAVKSIAARIDLLLVVGAPNSSNSKRLVEVGLKSGCPRATLVQRAERSRLVIASKALRRSASPPAPRRRKSSSTRSSMPSATTTT